MSVHGVKGVARSRLNHHLPTEESLLHDAMSRALGVEGEHVFSANIALVKRRN